MAYTALSGGKTPEYIEGKPPEPLATVAPTMGDTGLAAAVMAALALAPEAQPSDLNAWRVQLGLASPTTVTELPRSLTTRDRWWKAAAVAAIAVLAVMAAVLATQLQRMQDRQADADRQLRQRQDQQADAASELAERIAALEDGAQVPRVQSGMIRIRGMIPIEGADSVLVENGIEDNSRGCPPVNDEDRWRGHSDRRVDFPRPFESIPEVMVSISRVDYIMGQNLRLHLEVNSIDTTGFNYDFVTWCDTRLRSADMRWMAVAE